MIVIRNKPYLGNAVLSFIYVIQCDNTSSQLSESAKKIFVKAKCSSKILKYSYLANNTLRLNFRLK